MTTRIPRPKAWKAAPEGLHPAVCVDAWEIWTETNKFDGGLQDKTRLVWQIDKTYKDEKTGEEKRYEVSMPYTASFHEKAKLRQHLESWRGRKFTENELDQFYDGGGLELLLGKCCQLQVVHKISTNGNTYANVQTIVPPHPGMEKLIVTPDFVRRKDRTKDEEPHGQGDDGPMEGDYSDDDVPF